MEVFMDDDHADDESMIPLYDTNMKLYKNNRKVTVYNLQLFTNKIFSIFSMI